MICPHCHASMDFYGHVEYHSKTSKTHVKPAVLYECSMYQRIEIVEIGDRGCNGKVLYCEKERYFKKKNRSK